jgi:hypothetical protein
MRTGCAAGKRRERSAGSLQQHVISRAAYGRKTLLPSKGICSLGWNLDVCFRSPGRSHIPGELINRGNTSVQY